MPKPSVPEPYILSNDGQPVSAWVLISCLLIAFGPGVLLARKFHSDDV